MKVSKVYKYKYGNRFEQLVYTQNNLFCINLFCGIHKCYEINRMIPSIGSNQTNSGDENSYSHVTLR